MRCGRPARESYQTFDAWAADPDAYLSDLRGTDGARAAHSERIGCSIAGWPETYLLPVRDRAGREQRPAAQRKTGSRSPR